jgi:hypothetical protein
MRRSATNFTSAAAALATALALLTPTTRAKAAEAYPTTASVDASISPNRLDTPAALTVSIHYTGGEFGVPAPVRRSAVRLPAGMSISIPTLHSCSARRLLAHGASGCSRQSRLGGGHALIEARTGSQIISEQITLSVFLGAPENLQPRMEILAQGYTPYDQRMVLTGSVLQDQPPYGEEMIMSIPAIPTVPLEPDASIVTFSLTVGASGPRAIDANTILVPGSCPLGGFPFAAEFSYADGTQSATSTSTPCPS